MPVKWKLSEGQTISLGLFILALVCFSPEIYWLFTTHGSVTIRAIRYLVGGLAALLLIMIAIAVVNGDA